MTRLEIAQEIYNDEHVDEKPFDELSEFEKQPYLNQASEILLEIG